MELISKRRHCPMCDPCGGVPTPPSLPLTTFDPASHAPSPSPWSTPFVEEADEEEVESDPLSKWTYTPTPC